jgi:rifampin ADP-ribosylating transferase
MTRLDSLLRDPPPPAMVEHIRSSMGELAELGIEAMDD